MHRRLVLPFVLLAASLLVALPAAASQPAGPVTILTAISFENFPFTGTFSVSEGAPLLGCSGGTFVDYPGGVQPPSHGAIAKTFTCASATGTFVANFLPTSKPGPGDGNGHWTITHTSGAFAGLHGQGDFQVVYADDFLSGVETLTGVVHYEP